MNDQPTPETDAAWDALNRQACGYHYVAHKMRALERQRDGLLAALIGVIEEWEGGYRPEDCGTTMAIAREAIAAVKGTK